MTRRFELGNFTAAKNAAEELKKEEITIPHTAGPWAYTIDGGIFAEKDFNRKKEDISNWIATVEVRNETYEDHTFTEKSETLSNACLIAAAPDMLESLKALLKSADEYTGKRVGRVDDMFNKARAAVAKAEGK